GERRALAASDPVAPSWPPATRHRRGKGRPLATAAWRRHERGTGGARSGRLARIVWAHRLRPARKGSPPHIFSWLRGAGRPPPCRAPLAGGRRGHGGPGATNL